MQLLMSVLFQTAVVSCVAVIGGFVSWWSRPANCVCEIHSTEDNTVLRILREQLSRCGPENLGARACPPSPTVVQGHPWYAIYFLAGALCSTLYWQRAEILARVLRTQDVEEETEDIVAYGPQPRWSPGRSSSARRIQ